MSTVLVTGATGFIGRHLVESLIEEGYNVRALVRSLEKGKQLEEKGVELHKGDITIPETLKNIGSGVDFVFHLAALMKFHGAKWEDLYKINVMGTENLVKELLGEEIELFVLTSTTEVIGPCEKIPADEESPPNPKYEYGKSKLLAEELVRRYHKEHGFPVTIIRPSGVYGPGDLYITYSTIRAIARGLLSRLPGGGENYIQFAFVKDVVQGYLRVIESYKRAMGETYIITSEDFYTYKEAFTIIADLLGVKPPKGSMPIWLAKTLIWFIEKWNSLRGVEDFVFHTSVVDDMLTNRVYSIDKAKKELNYRPQYKFREGMEITIKWFKENGLL